jgi:penicillin-binding protein 1A
MGHGAQGGRIAAPIFKQFAQAAFAGMPKIPFVAPPGIRMVRIDRVTGKKVFGSFPTTVDPKSSVIWEAFQPETEPRRSFRRSVELAKAQVDGAATQQASSPRPARRPRPGQPRAPADSGEFLQRQGGIY